MAEHTTTTMDGLFRHVYGDRLENLLPEETSLAKDIKFVESDQREGNRFNQPVRLTRSHGVTVNTGGTAYALNAAEPCVTDEAYVNGISCTARDSLAYDVIAKLKKTPKEGKTRAFVEATSYAVESLYESMRFYREVALLHGSVNIGITSGQYADNGTSQTFTFTAATFIPGFWSGMENAFVDVWDTTEATQRNSTGTMKVTAVDIDNRRVTFLGTETEMDAIVSTDRFFLRGFLGLSLVGARGLFSNAGTLFGVDATAYSQFLGNTYAAGGAQLIFATLLHALNKPSNRGFSGTMNVYCSPNSWNDAMNNLAALRRYVNRGGGKLEQGADELVFHTHNGRGVLKPHLLMKPSEAIGIPAGKCKRVGASDITFRLPGTGENFFSELPDNAGVQLRSYFNQALFSAYPCHGFVITGLVNSDQ